MLELWFPGNSPRYFSSGLHVLLLSLVGSILQSKSLQSPTALQKAGFPGCSKTPLTLPPSTCTGPAGIDAELGHQRPAAPRRTSPTPEEEEGKLRWRVLGASSGDPRRPARPGEGPEHQPALQLEGSGEGIAPNR